MIIICEFLKLAYNLGKVIALDDSMQECSLQEPKEIYSFYEVGDIVFVKNYQYSSKKAGTNHLFVIIEQTNIGVPIENIGMLISSKIQKQTYKANKLISKSKKNGLNVDSIVKTDILYKISNSQILFRIGSIDHPTIEAYKRQYKLLLQNSK